MTGLSKFLKKNCLPQNLLSPLLNTLPHVAAKDSNLVEKVKSHDS